MLYRMKGYGQFCPVALAAEVFAERWTPLILRELLSGARRFADIHRGVPRISRNLLCQRLDTLAHIGIIERKPLANARGSSIISPRPAGSSRQSLSRWEPGGLSGQAAIFAMSTLTPNPAAFV